MNTSPSFEFYNHEKANGQMYIAQLFMEIFIEDTSNPMKARVYAMEIHKWLGTAKTTTIHKIFDQSHLYGNFILEAMEKYTICCSNNAWGRESNFITNIKDTMTSLEYQRDLYDERDYILSQMAITAISDNGYNEYV